MGELRDRKADIVAFLKTVAANTDPAPTITPVDRQQPLPLSFAQERFWSLAQLNPQSPGFNMPMAYRFKGQLDRKVLEKSLATILQRHEILRTTFVTDKGQLCQQIAEHLPLPLEWIDLTHLPTKDREAAAQDRANQLAKLPFDLAQGPLVRFHLLALEADNHIILWNFHSIICDGTSLDRFFQELVALYSAFVQGQPDPLLPLTVQYADFAHWQRQQLQGETLQHLLDYWQSQSQKLPVLPLPTDRPRPLQPSKQGDRCARLLPKALSEELNRVSQEAGTTLFMTLLAAFKVLLYRYSGQTDLVVNAAIANRQQPELDTMLGYLRNTLILRTSLGGSNHSEVLPSFRDILERVRQVSLAAYQHQDLPFERLVEDLRPDGARGGAPLFQTAFALNPPWKGNRGMASQYELPRVTLSSLFGYVYIGASSYDLALTMRETDKGLRTVVEYNTHLFDEATVENLINQFHALLDGIVTNPGCSIDCLPLMSPATQQQMLADWPEAVILDSHQQLLPTGIPGQVYLTETGRSQATLPTAIESPISLQIRPDQPAISLYPTEQKGRRHANGTLLFITEESVEAIQAVPQVSPRNTTEHELVQLWQETLGIQPISVYENFFALGGYSLLATKIVSNVSQKFQIDLPLRSIFDYPTIAGFAQRIEQISKLSSEVTIANQYSPSYFRVKGRIKSIPRNKSEYLPLSFTQKRLWILDKLEPESAAYNMPRAFRLGGFLDLSALEQSLSEIISRHEVLRTTFRSIDHQAVQVISPPYSVKLVPVNLQAIPMAERLTKASRLVAEESNYLFDLGQGPLIRFNLYQLAEDDHIFMMNVHHIVFDGWSSGLFLQELSTLYAAFCKGNSSPLLPLPIQYGDFANWQQKWLKSDELQVQLDYWKQHLENSSHILELPTDYPRPPVQTHHGSSYIQELPGILKERLLQLGQQEKATLFMILLTAFKVLCNRFTRQEKITIGSPIAGRNWAEVESLIGFFVNNLVLHTDLSGTPSLRELLRRVRQTVLEAFDHQEIPFEVLLEVLKPKRDLSRTPLFQVWFNMLNLDQKHQQLKLSDLAVEPFLGTADVTSKFDLTLYVKETAAGLTISWVFNRDLFEENTIQMMSRCFGAILEQMVKTPDQSIATIPLLNNFKPNSKRSIFSPKKSPKIPFSEFKKTDIEQSIPARFAVQVCQNPGRIAIHTNQYQWTYQELNSHANQIAQTILACNPSLDAQQVALLIEHDAPMIAGILGVLQAGKTYVPLDPQYPVQRLTYILQDTQAAAIVVTRNTIQLAQQLVGKGMPILDIDDLPELEEAASLPMSNVAISPDASAYILYTSGSTGKPKGVVQNHRNILHFIQNHTNQLKITAADRILLLASYSFDAAVVDIFSALLNGATIYPFDVKAEGLSGLLSYLAKNQITLYHSTPTLYRYFLKQHGSTVEQLKQLTSIRAVVLGGEVSLPEDVERYQQFFSDDCIFVNLYGSTESTISLQHIVTQRANAKRRIISIGHPFDETEILLLNEDGSDAQVYGEIAVRSPYLALGYWQQTELTQNVFLSDPKDSRFRIYRTGDLGRLHADGSIEFLGRQDFQIKLRGFRIELPEVEVALESHPQVQKAVVMGHESDGEKRLVAYILAAPQKDSISVDLRRFTQQKLPDYMVPSVYVFLDEIPLTPNGKVDRKRLPSPNLSEQNISSNFAFPQNELETTLLQIWENVLKIKRINCTDNFFDLGGHSLLAIQLFDQIAKHFDLHLPMAILFQAPTIRELAATLQQKNWKPRRSSVVPINTQGDKPPLFFHGGAADALTWANVARQLGPDQPFYALERPDLNGPPLDDDSVESLAALALADIRTVQPHGPYHLAGHCFGGMVMVEVAQQLRAEGETVALLALIDAYAPTAISLQPKVPTWLYRIYQQLDRGRFWLQKTAYYYGPGQGWEPLLRQWTKVWQRARQKAAFDRQKQQVQAQAAVAPRDQANSPVASAAATLPYAVRYALAERACRAARRTHIPQTYPDPVVVIQPSYLLERWRYGNLQGWASVLTGNVRVETIPGLTGNLFNRQSLPKLVQVLQELL
jgi:amino acid adenylation domain-containing protein